MAKKLKVWNGASWEDVTFAITPPTTNVTNEFSTNQIIDTSTNVAALRITQRGSGEALRVEDETNPDSSPFVINASGNVGIGTASPSDTLTIARSSGEVVLGIRNSGTASAWLTLSPGSSGAAYIHNIGNTSTVFTTNSAERMRINSSGNVGIGTSSPVNRLHVVTSEDYSTATFESSGGEVNISLKSTSTNGRDYRIVSGGSAGGFAGGLFGLYDATVGAIRFYITSNGSAVFNNTNGEFLSQVNGVNKLQVTNGAVKIWAGRGGLEGGEMYLASTGSANGYNNNNDAVFDVYDGSVRLSADGFGKIYYLRPAADNGTTMGIRNVIASTSSPSGGYDGDLWAVYV